MQSREHFYDEIFEVEFMTSLVSKIICGIPLSTLTISCIILKVKNLLDKKKNLLNMTYRAKFFISPIF